VTQLLDRLIGDAGHVEVHHRVVTGTVDDVDHPGQERLDRPPATMIAPGRTRPGSAASLRNAHT